MQRTILYLFALLLVFASCKKKDNAPSSSTDVDRHIIFANHIGNPIHFFIYKTRDDYKNSASPIIAVDIAPGSFYDWYTKTLSLDYYLDWYTDGYLLTNWSVVQPFIVLKTLGQFPFNFDYILSANTLKDTVDLPLNSVQDFPARKTFINGNDPQTIWKAIDAVDTANHSIWQTLSPDQQYWKLTLNKDMIFSLESKGPAGADIQTGIYAIGSLQYPMQQAALYFDSSNAADPLSQPLFAKNITALPHPYFFTTKDTLLFTLGPVNYLLARQH